VADTRHRPWSRRQASRGLRVASDGGVYVAVSDRHDRRGHPRVTTQRPVSTSLSQYLHQLHNKCKTYRVGQIKRDQLTFLLVTSGRIYKIK